MPLPRPPVAMSNLMVPVVRQLQRHMPNCMRRSQGPTGQCPPRVLTNEDRGGLCNLAHILVWVMGVGRLEGRHQEPEGET